ncbi:MAG: 30S ribosomal protein S16 [Candidatus Glassbacteria bacterium]|nr:30S ribosomal protein S16 [Candidatus Glassbacteria bacterium]
MSVKIRLRRMGKKKQPHYRLAVVDSRVKRDGRFIEFVGRYVPTTDPHTVEFKEDRLFYWLGEGAICSDTVSSLLRQNGLLQKWHELKAGKAKAEDKKTAAAKPAAGESAETAQDS